MRKLIKLCCVTVTICFSLLIINMFRTNEINRINHIEDGLYTLHFYLSNQQKSSEEVMTFLTNLSKKQKVSIVKTDNNGSEVIKSVILNKTTFPSSNFGLKKIDFSSNPKGQYTNKKVENQLGYIKTFLKAKTIKLQLLSTYFEDNSHSINGQYSLVSTYHFNQKKDN
ncbi:hypothetical protein HMPREF9318_01854 [Streptococcus urinalis FB127-CNA-2]|nr:hypothetical protein [Streptococcus urinalis]EKS17405.1 hypothetical protein HMPREF9318_01854 [Streptococcus urinalis FB127-CNA-2]VEF32772.1 amino acid ABC transporter [Streptococcus urinalis]